MSKLLDRTRELLEGRPLNDLAQIATDTGLPLTWLHAVRYKKGTTPSVNRIETLYEYLSGNKLEVK